MNKPVHYEQRAEKIGKEINKLLDSAYRDGYADGQMYKMSSNGINISVDKIEEDFINRIFAYCGGKDNNLDCQTCEFALWEITDVDFNAEKVSGCFLEHLKGKNDGIY